jgi:glucose-6-phosphate 1-epimerase
MGAKELAAEFGIAGKLDFSTAGTGLTKAVVTLDGVAGELVIQGAQLTRWDPPGEHPVVFMSPNSVFAPGTAIRGGVPLIFPWFGPHRSAKEAPQHGFARVAPWRLDSVEQGRSGELTMSLSLTSDATTSPFWPDAYRAVYTVTFGRTLSLSLAVQNRAGKPIVFEEALHTYFAVSDISQVAVTGLGGKTYIDKTDGMQRKTQEAPRVTLAKETDSLYLNTSGRCAIEDPQWRRRIAIDSSGANSTVVWNPWSEKAAAMRDLGDPAWRGMICVENANAADNEVRLAADSEHRMSAQIAVDAIG